MLTLRNSFHNTRARVRGYDSAERLTDDYASAWSRLGTCDETVADRRLVERVRRIRRTLCPHGRECLCGDTLGQR